MRYKTMALELIESIPRLHERLRLSRRLLPTMEACAEELRIGCQMWQGWLREANPEKSPEQIASEALELALSELQARLRSEWEEDDGTLTLDEAMTYLRDRTSIG